MTTSLETFKLSFETKQFIEDHEIDKTNLLPQVGLNIKYLPIKYGKTLISGEDVKTVVEIGFDNLKSLLEFEAGDTLNILPENNDVEINKLLCIIGMDKHIDSEYQLNLIDNCKKPVKPPKHIPLNGSLRHCFKHFIDIRRFLSKKLIGILGKYTQDENEKLSMEKICKEKGLYSDQVLEANLSIVDFLEKFPSCKPTIEILMEHLPQISPRPYSICNSSKADKTVIKICFSIITFKNKRKGLTTGWLESLIQKYSSNGVQYIEENLQNICITTNYDANLSKQKPLENIKIPLYLKSSTFHLPSAQNLPILMICNGTGISPFIGFLEEIEELKINSSQLEYGSTYLYYGCRFSTKDFLYKNEISKFLEKNILSKFYGAYSRENETSAKYIQDQLYMNKDEVFNILDSQAIVFVCGSNVMIKEVEKLLVQLLVQYRCITESDAKFLIKNMKKDNQYIVDIWT